MSGPESWHGHLIVLLEAVTGGLIAFTIRRHAAFLNALPNPRSGAIQAAMLEDCA